MCRFLIPTQEHGKIQSDSTDNWHGSCISYVYSARNGKNKTRRQMAVFGGSGISTSVLFTVFLRNCHAKSQCFESFFGWVPALVLKNATSPSPLILITVKKYNTLGIDNICLNEQLRLTCNDI